MQGDAQVGRVGEFLDDSLVVRVLAGERPVAGVVVSWEFAHGSGDGVVSERETTTDGSGEASVAWRLGAAADIHELSAVVEGLDPVVFTAVARPGPASTLTVRPDTLRFETLGDTARFAVEWWDRFGNPVSEPLHPEWAPVRAGVAEIDTMGLVTAVGDGATAVVARAGEAVDTAFVEVRLAVESLGITAFLEGAFGEGTWRSRSGAECGSRSWPISTAP